MGFRLFFHYYECGPLPGFVTAFLLHIKYHQKSMHYFLNGFQCIVQDLAIQSVIWTQNTFCGFKHVSLQKLYTNSTVISEQSVHLFVTNTALTTGPALPGGLSVAKRYCYFRLEVWISQSCPICIYIYILPNENGFTSLIFFINLAVCLITLFI